MSKRNGTRILTISDHLEWTDYEYHSMALQGKINYYLEYIYAGNLHEKESGPGRGAVRIQLMMKHEPSAEATELLKKIEGEIEKLGFEFVSSVFREEWKSESSSSSEGGDDV